MFTKDIFKTKFDTEYGRLNQEQKQAVDTIEGPVMVIAGAGTGKTQTIALRIANILLKTQTPPGAILCLTFTENAAINMRQRLISIIGQQAYRIKIHTFHSFCNEVILSNPQNFIFASEVEPLDELGRIEIIQNLIENLPNGAVLKPWGDHFYYQREIISRIQHLKRENVSPEKMLELVNQEQFFINQAASVFADIRSMRAGKDLEAKVLQAVENIAAIPGLSLPFISLLHLNADLYHQGQFAEGKAKSPAVNFKNYLLHFYDSQAKAIPKQTELQQIYLGYQQELKKRGVYDFDDMILFVLNAFKNDRELLLQYQEKFQYILVDEYQDTNSAQNQILDLLGSYFDIPNLFVVGDDDQSIFRFQGAAIENIFDFYQKYQANIKVVVLKNNYRSHQLILDTSQSVISNNRNRIANYIKNIDKSLVSVQSVDPDPVNVYAAPNSISENYFIVQKIKSLLDSGVSPQQIAVLYRNNSDITDLTEMMDISKLSYQLETGSDVLDNVHIRQLVNLLAYIKDPVDDALLFKVLSYPFLKINSLDLFKIVRYSHRHGLPLSDLIASAEDLANISPALQKNTLTRLRNFKIRLAKAKKWLEIYSLDKFFNKVIRRFGFLSYLLSLNNVEEVGCLKEFYSELKRLSIEENFNLTQFLDRLSLLIQNKLPLPVSPVNGDYSDSIRLMTVHKAKGLEFEHVFLIKVLDKKWGNNINTTSLPLPMGILKTEVSVMTVQDENEEERRLFYVALTRAKKQIYISYPVRTDAGRELMPSMFLAEIDPKLIQPVTPEKEVSRQAILSLFPLEESVFFRQPNLAAYLKHFIKTDYKFNVTHLNSYLNCPLCFYFKTILRIPASKDKFASLGTAVHASLSFLFNYLKNQNKLLSKDELLEVYRRNLLRENLSQKNFDEVLYQGAKHLSDYYDHYQSEFNCECLIDYDFKPDNVFMDGIPLTGKVDKIDILPSINNGLSNVNVIDFKTGNPDTKAQEMKLGADYFRQLVFYKILADNDPNFKYHVTSGSIDFVQKSKRSDKFVKKDYPLTDKDVAEVKVLIREVYQKILNLEFDPSPDCEDRDGLHELIK